MRRFGHSFIITRPPARRTLVDIEIFSLDSESRRATTSCGDDNDTQLAAAAAEEEEAALRERRLSSLVPIPMVYSVFSFGTHASASPTGCLAD